MLLVYLGELKDGSGNIVAQINGHKEPLTIPKRLKADLYKAVKVSRGQRARLSRGALVPFEVGPDTLAGFGTLEKMFQGLMGG